MTNLLLNPAPPSIFHPSNLLSTSTPVRPRLSEHNHNHPPPSPSSAADADITFDPSETPIRGHNVFPKSATSKIRGSSSARPQSGENLSASNSKHQRGLPGRGGGNARLPYSSGVGASQGVLPPHPEASPSESDHTDTDSNNVTHPTTSENLPRPSSSSRPHNILPVVGSTDTEFDFPTSDFNNVYDEEEQQQQQQLNDLSSRRNDLSGVKVKGVKEQTKGQGDCLQASAAASSAVSVSVRSGDSQKGAGLESRRVSSPSPTNQLSGRSNKSQNSHRQSPSPVGSRSSRTLTPTPPPPSAERVPPTTTSHISTPSSHSAAAVPPAKTAISELAGPGSPGKTGPPTADSFDDELLFGEDGSPPKTETSTARGPGGDRASSKNNRNMMKVLPGLQMALSSDLASFSQRSPLRSGVGAGENIVSNTSPREVGGPPPSSRNNKIPSLSPRPDEGSASARGGGSKDPSLAKNALPSPTCAAVRDWVSHKTESEPSSARSIKQKTEKQAETAGQLPFTAYSLADPSPRNLLTSAQERLQWGEVAESSAARSVLPPSSSHALSGPSSDPVVSNLPAAAATSSAGGSYSARDGRPSSTSLPTHTNLSTITTTTKQDTSTESLSNKNRSDNNSGFIASTKMTPSSSSSSALVTEKLMSGAVFSPIHPQPVSTTGGVLASGRGGRAVSTSSGNSGSCGIIHPTPVSVSVAAPSSGASVMSSASFSMAERDQARVSLVGCHEDQLAAITSLCKQEMKLLLHAKKAVPRSFDDYLGRVGGILLQKMAAIQQLQDSIRHYQARFSIHPNPTTNPPAAGAGAGAGASSNDSAGLFFPPPQS